MLKELLAILENKSENHSQVVYHGTTIDRLEAIKEKGLVADNVKRNFKQHEYSGERSKSVFVSTERGEAQGWPGLRDYNHGNVRVVIKITIPADELSKLKDDELRGDGTSFRFLGNIPLSWIDGYSVQDTRTHKWSDFLPLSNFKV